MIDWQPMDTFPHDGRVVEVEGQNGKIGEAFWGGGKLALRADIDTPVHWRPVRRAPMTETKPRFTHDALLVGGERLVLVEAELPTELMRELRIATIKYPKLSVADD